MRDDPTSKSPADRPGASDTPDAPATGLRNDPTPHLQAAQKHLGLDQPLQPPRTFSLQDLTLPPAGGALRAIGEKFRANPATGTGSLAVPLTVTPARGLEPQLSLSYDSGAGQSPFGLGWSVSPSAIRRKTDKGLPQYADHDDSDVFILSDAEDLVPYRTLVEGTWTLDQTTRYLDDHGREVDSEHEEAAPYTVRRYRPRNESGFARIERWTRVGDRTHVHWRVRDRDNRLSLYGYDPAARLTDPANPRRIFSWHLQEVTDDRGNRMVFLYDADNNTRGVSTALHDTARADGAQLFVQRYLRAVRYGNATPHGPLEPTKDDWLFELRFDYGDLGHRQVADQTFGPASAVQVPHHPDSTLTPETPSLDHPPERTDPFSSHRSGFEVRTRWLCSRIVLFHFVDVDTGSAPTTLQPRDDDGKPLPVAAWLLTHDAQPHLTTLTAVQRVGFRLQPDGALHAHAAPAATFAYVPHVVAGTAEALSPSDAALLPHGIDNQRFRFVDLDNDGIPGLLSEQGGQWWYQRNLGDPARWTDPDQARPRLGPLRRVSPLPNTADLSAGAQLTDIDGSGRTAVLVRNPDLHGYTQRDHDGTWTAFHRFRHLPQVDWTDPSLRFLDLTGDGRPDLLLTEHRVLRWWPSEGPDGWGPEQRVRLAIDPGGDPRLLFTSDKEAVLFADMTGDGLQDLVRVRRTTVTYWPNQGYGRFGLPVTLGNAPTLASHTAFDPARVRLADVDGTGPADLLYLDHHGATLVLNQAGNTFAAPLTLDTFPGTTTTSHTDLVDLLGDGTQCLLWSSPLDRDRARPLRYLRLAAHGKPHLLNHLLDGHGGETHLDYAPSTASSLADQDAGRPWATRLHFPVQVLTRIAHTDHTREHRQVLTFAYHHGTYDPTEREFRGFGMVEQRDAEQLHDLDPDAPFTATHDHVTPTLTKTWFHTGVWRHQDTLLAAYATEYWDGDPAHPTLPRPRLPKGLPPTTRAHAHRALKGAPLREEVWADDPNATAPFAVTHTTYEVRLLQPAHADAPPVFARFPRESLHAVYEQTPDDPRLQHTFALQVDDLGTVTHSLALAYPRRANPEGSQGTLLAVQTRRDVQHDQTTPTRHRLAVPWQLRAWELHDLDVEPGALLSWNQAAEAADDSETPRTLLAWQVVRYADPTTSEPLDLGDIFTAPLLPADTHTLAMADELLTTTLDARLGWDATDRATALDAAGYLDLDDTPLSLHTGITFTPTPLDRWLRSGSATYDPEAFFLPTETTDPFGAVTALAYDLLHLAPISLTAFLGAGGTAPSLTVSATYDPQNRQLASLTDPNGLTRDIRFDPLARPTHLRLVDTDAWDQPTVRFFYADATFTDDRWHPAWTHTAARRFHLPDDATSATVTPDIAHYDHTRTYLDATGQPLQTKARCAPGPAPKRDTNGDLDLLDGEVQYGATDPRTLTSGRVLLNAKGQPVQQFEPFFSDRWDFETDDQLTLVGVTPTLSYDPLGRLTRTDLPDGTHTTVSRTPWSETHHDAIDNLPDVFLTGETTPLWAQRTLDEYTEAIHPDPAPDVDTLDDEVDNTNRIASAHPWLERHLTAPDDTALDERTAAAMRQAAFSAYASRRTPTTVHLDPLGRPFLEQRLLSPAFAEATESTPLPYASTGLRLFLDLLGRAHRIDAEAWSFDHEHTQTIEARRATLDAFDLLGRSLLHVRADAQHPNDVYDPAQTEPADNPWDKPTGTTTTLPDLDGQPLQHADCRDHHFVHTYDLLRRPTSLRLRTPSNPDHVLHWLRYGIDRPSPPSGSHPLGKLWQVYDSAGLVEHTAYDVDGNLIEQERTFLDANHTDATWRAADDALPDWAFEADATGSTSLAPLESTAHTQSWTYDAAGRLLTHTLPDGRDADPTVLTRTYDTGGRLLSLSRNHRGDSTPTDDLTDITYNARGQRETIGYGNGVTTSFTYDPLTFRLTGLHTVRPDTSPSWPTTLQDLRYVYDPHGNPTWTDDRAIDDQTYGGVLITAQRTYIYDGLDRLIEATGRGHNSDLPSAADPAVYIAAAVAHPNDAPALHNYTRTYTYDLFGNRTELVHTAHVSGTPTVTTQETPTATGHNRLASYTVGTGTFSPTYDHHGNMTEMAHLPLMAYNALDRLAVVSGTAGSTPDRWRYFYDTAGERVRKLLIAGSATVLKERRYLGASEVYIEWSGSTETLLRETVHVHDEAGRVLLVDTDVIGGDAGTADEVKTRFQLADHLGSVSIELDEDAAVVTYEEYFPYGCAAFRGGRSESEVNNKRYRYTGMERDDESGLRYHSQRYYASWLGRWVRPDPAGLVDGANLHAYARSRPDAGHDRRGTFFELLRALFTSTADAPTNPAPSTVPDSYPQSDRPPNDGPTPAGQLELEAPPTSPTTPRDGRPDHYGGPLHPADLARLQVRPRPDLGGDGTRVAQQDTSSSGRSFGPARPIGDAISGTPAAGPIDARAAADDILLVKDVVVDVGGVGPPVDGALRGAGPLFGGMVHASKGARLLPNQGASNFADELAQAASVGVSPMRAGGAGFDDLANSGTMKWVITESGELVVGPHTRNGVEISHAVLSGGAPVRAAGQANIAAAGGQRFGIDISAHSGHFMDGMPASVSDEVVEMGRAAFSAIGVSF